MAEKTIGVSETTHKRLAFFCGKLRTYDEAINVLIDIAEKEGIKGDTFEG